MVRRLRSAAVGAGAALLAAAAAACTGSGDPVSTEAAPGAGASVSTGQAQRGGSLQVLVAGTVATWDPQLMYVGPEAFFAQRTFARGLTAYGTGVHERDVEGDLATDAGTPSDGARTWVFTLRPGLTWQDGSPVTCEDVRHGVARTFDRRTHIGGTNYASFLLDIPQADDTVRGEGGYIALSATKALHLHGSGVRSYEDHPVGGSVDVATVAVR